MNMVSEETRMVPMDRHSENWLTFLMREYVRRMEFDAERARKLSDIDAEIRDDIVRQQEWMISMATARNDELCRDFGIGDWRV